MNAQELIRDFGASSNLPDFALDERGLARLKLDSDIIIDFEHDTNQNVLHVYSTIAPAAPGAGEAQMRLLLEANLFLDRSGGAACALDSLTGEYIACLRLDPQLYDGQALMTWLERLADAVERLRAELVSLGHEGSTAAVDELGSEREIGHPFA
jgi:hypothetical protein